MLYLTPSNEFFLTGFALSQKAIDTAHQRGLPQSILDLIDSSQKFAEGRGVRFEVQTAGDVKNMVAVAEIKMAN